MKRFQKVLFALVAVVLLGWVGASTASAQVAFLASGSGARRLRFEGLTEATGTIVLSSTSLNGVIGGRALVGSTLGGTQIVFDFGTLVNSAADFNPADAVNAPPACSGSVVAAGFTAPPAITKTCLGNTVILIFTADATCTAACSISLSGTRVNANFRGAGASISVNISTFACVPAACANGQQVTASPLGSLVVGTVQPGPSTTTTALASSGGVGLNIPLCTVANLAANLGTVTYTVVENFSDAFLSAADENGLGNTLSGATPPVSGANASAFRIRFRFSNIINGLRIAPTAFGPATSASLGVLVLPAGFTSTAEDAENDFDVTIPTTSQTGIETLVVVFTFSIPNLAAFDATKEGSSTLSVRLKGATDTPQGPVFATSGASIQLSNTAVRTIVCASYLLFPWVAYVADGSLDTGIAISNTSADPAVLGTVKQKGDVTLYFWTADGSTAPSPLKIATALDAGKSATFVASSLGKAFTGYIIATCGFQFGHGLAAFLAPKAGVFGASYLALSLPNPRLGGGGGGVEALGQ